MRRRVARADEPVRARCWRSLPRQLRHGPALVRSFGQLRVSLRRRASSVSRTGGTAAVIPSAPVILSAPVIPSAAVIPSAPVIPSGARDRDRPGRGADLVIGYLNWLLVVAIGY